MQFGKIHGIALAILGVILLGIQGMLYMPTGKIPTGGTASSAPVVEHKTNPVVGILGIGFLFAGAAIFFYEASSRRTRSEACRQIGPNGLAFWLAVVLFAAASSGLYLPKSIGSAVNTS